ncbi:alpha/beta hydrolase [Thalassotalea profundi]|uniref:Phospholipase/carboxylesterase/thioesterase domain-containing protein n=1 Tax=Thalassotalea profundi TaxID=2036687 RepID=A0ABQ3IW79_9GAMM|nr:alpha/beta hydrolase [Thalassotalea profundi]GHE91831.1 hypothetical protein GCM10011501_21590 [Thalassotalea profundi]
MRKIILLALISTKALAGEIFDTFPLTVKANEKYVFYSHGYIVEGTNPRPVNPRWGTYEFPMIKQALSDKNYNLIAYHRAKNTNPNEFAKRLADDVRLLIKKGVPANNISLVGFSRGGTITIMTSNLLANNQLNFIILAGCSSYIKESIKIVVHGKIYSILETSDDLVGSCQFLIDRSKNVTRFTEQSISTGKEHGAFYTPRPEWVTPVKKWLKTNNENN